MKDVLAPEVVDGTGRFRALYQSATPFRHLTIDGFFRQEFAACLLAEFPPFEERLALNENGQVGGKCTHENLQALGGAWLELDRLIRSEEFLGWLEAATGIPDLLYDPHYFGGGTHENRHGQDLDPHVDFDRHPLTGWHRRLNLIVYLNEDWRPEWGGAIEFHKDPRLPSDQNEIRLVEPLMNRAVLFETTHWSWHGFERVDLPKGDADPRSRKSVALYFYSIDRPPEEQVKPHSTIYVERPLPARIRPGVTLSEADHAEILRLLNRRDQHLQRLYGYIADLNQQLEDIRSAVPRTLYRRIRALGGRTLRRMGLLRGSQVRGGRK